MTDSVDEVPACPGCDSASVRKKSPKGRPYREDPEDYRCKKCGVSFDEPVFRESQNRIPSGRQSGSELVARLARADPDDVGGDA